jgi:signal transduction histidine kinase/DNA-binding response OmpR family regulator/streptogramin lyase
MNSIPSMIKDSRGNIWFCIAGLGIVKYDDGEDVYTSFEVPELIWISDIVEDQNGNLWMGGEKLIFFNTTDSTFEKIDDFNDNNPEGSITALHFGNNYKLWIGTKNNGLWLYDIQNSIIRQFKHDPSNPYSLNSDRITCIYEDNQDNIWIGTKDGGINIIKNQRKPFYHYQHNPEFSNGLSSSKIQNFYESKNGQIWIATYGGGLNLFDRETQTFKHYIHDPENPFSLGSDRVNNVLEDSEGYIWALGFGLHKMDPVTGKFNSFKNPPLSWGLYEDSEGIIWISSANGLGRYDKQNSSLRIYIPEKSNKNSISHKFISSVYEDSKGNFWVCTEGGVNKFDRHNQEFKKVTNIHIYFIWEDKESRLFMNDGSRIYQFFAEKDSLTNIVEFEGGNSLACLQDDTGNFWFGTKNGIVKYDIDQKDYKRFGESDGLYIEDFNAMSAFYKTSDSYLLFGSNKGFVMFHPDSITVDTSTYPIVFTDFKLFNRSVPIRGSTKDTLHYSTPLDLTIPFTEQVTLTYDQNIFSFEFAVLNFTTAEKCQYRYKLEGFNDEWTFTDAHYRQATFTNLNAGSYIFKVMGSNEDGIWNDQEASIRIRILPPPWRTWWAYTIYAIGFLGLFYGSFRFFIIRERLKSKLELEHLELRKMRELDKMKNQFFANISHELRTPLTLILGPIKQMFKDTFRGDPKTIMGMVIRNGNRLLNLINQLLDYSKLEAGSIQLQVSEGDMVSFQKLMFAHFESTAQSRNIKYVFQSDASKILAYFDKKQFENIMINLLGNAFKFTDDGGQIILRINKSVVDKAVDQGNGVLEIEVDDNGIGIESAKLPYVFDRFYQVDESYTRFQEGSGIGLSLVNELIKLHHGSVSVSSKRHHGSTFTIHLPLGKLHLEEETIADQVYDPSRIQDVMESYQIDHEISITKQYLSSHLEEERILLIVDDNRDMRAYINEELSSEFLIIEASNGKSGLEEAIRHIPDLVISDVMMPVMDGNELCQRLKQDERTSHIPVVLLTAKAGEEAKLEGLETGADDYITKPFSPVELKVRVSNLIDQREKLIKRFKSVWTSGATQLPASTADQKFLKRILETLSSRFQDPDLSAELFSKEVGLSRSQLHRKLKALTGQSTNEFIRIYRLNFASKLIEKQFGNIAEVSYESGFNNPSYFAECFKKQFGLSPSEYTNKFKV